MTDFLSTSSIDALSAPKRVVPSSRSHLRSVEVLSRELMQRELNTPLRRINLALKRMMDIVGSALALAILSPILIAAAIAVKLESRGPVFFIQERWGKGQKRIRVFKFRSMYADVCDASGVAQTVQGDSRITKVGALLRRTNIDELPQLINVLKGDMSLVGPRCHVMGMQAGGVDYEELVPQYHLRHLMRPGITGLAQMRGLRGPTAEVRPSVRRVRSDLEYILAFNSFLDIAICFGTVWNELRRGSGF